MPLKIHYGENHFSGFCFSTSRGHCAPMEGNPVLMVILELISHHWNFWDLKPHPQLTHVLTMALACLQLRVICHCLSTWDRVLTRTSGVTAQLPTVYLLRWKAPGMVSQKNQTTLNLRVWKKLNILMYRGGTGVGDFIILTFGKSQIVSKEFFSVHLSVNYYWEFAY